MQEGPASNTDSCCCCLLFHYLPQPPSFCPQAPSQPPEQWVMSCCHLSSPRSSEQFWPLTSCHHASHPTTSDAGVRSFPWQLPPPRYTRMSEKGPNPIQLSSASCGGSGSHGRLIKVWEQVFPCFRTASVLESWKIWIAQSIIGNLGMTKKATSKYKAPYSTQLF